MPRLGSLPQGRVTNSRNILPGNPMINQTQDINSKYEQNISQIYGIQKRSQTPEMDGKQLMMPPVKKQSVVHSKDQAGGMLKANGRPSSKGVSNRANRTLKQAETFLG